MRRDLDRLMRERGLAGMAVFAHDRYCPAMYYAAGRKFHRAIYVRAADGRTHLVVDPMERDDAVKTGLDYSTLSQHRWLERVDRLGPAAGHADLIADLLQQLGIAGPIAFFGDLEASFALELLEQIMRRAPGVTVDRALPDLLSIARSTKDPDELRSIRHASDSVVRAYNALRDHLATLRPQGDQFVNGGGVVTLGQLRALLHRQFLTDGLEGGESIVSQGRDAGVPHNRGNDDEPLRKDEPVIVDIFPGEAGGGYHSDFTRTFCMGPAPEPLRKLYDDCRAAFETVMGSLAGGAPCRSYQEKTCDVFEARGHATVRSRPGTEEGYVHSLGHGVGLAVHEAPRLGGPPANTQALEPGMVVTIEPGLYYPSRGLGVRIEDLVVMRPDGGYDNYTPAPYDLEITPRG